MHVHVLCELISAVLLSGPDRTEVQQANVGKLYNTLLSTER